MLNKIIIAGAGGQGIMLLGKILSQAAMREDKFVTWLPSYGAEVRGGTAHCMIIISDEEIGSPCVSKADTLIIMNQPSWEKFKSRGQKSGLAIVNSSLAHCESYPDLEVITQPFTDIAIKLGNIKIANMVALGSFLAKKCVVKIENVLKTIEEIAPADKKGLVEINQKALLHGVELVNKNKDKK